MKTPSANYTTYDTATKKPVVVAQFDSITRKYSSQTFGDIDANYKKYIINATHDVQTLDLLHSPVSSEERIEVTILDKDADVTSQLNTADFEGRGMTVKVGFQELNIADFVSFPEMKIRKTVHGSELLSYTLISKDARKKLQQEIFRNPPQTAINGAITATDATITVDDASVLIPTTAFGSPTYLSVKILPAIKIGGEIIEYGGISGNDLTTCVRGKFGTEAIAHADNTEVVQMYIFQAQNDATLGYTLLWSEMLLYVLMTADSGSGHDFYDLSNCDAAFDDIGCGMSASEVDVEGIERLGYEIQHPFPLYAIDKPINALNFIEDRILRPFGLYMYVDSNNKLTVNSFEWIHLNENFSAVTTLTDSDITGATMEQGEDFLVNYVRVDHDETLLPLTGHQEGELDSSVTAYGKTETPFVIKFPGAFVFGTTQATEWNLSKWLYFWGNVPAFVTLNVKFSEWLLEVGDYIQITYDKLPDLNAGTIGWTTKKALILGKRDNFGCTQDASFEIDCITWENVQRVSDFYTLDGTVAEGSITRTAMTESVDKTDTLEAADAYHDFASQITPDIIIATLRITPPNSGTTHHSMSFKFHAQENTGGGTYVTRGNKDINSVRFYSGDSVAFTIDFMWISTGATSNVDRIKVDWYASTASGAETPTPELIQIKHITLDENITAS